MSEKESPKSKLEYVKSLSTIGIWVVGIIFGAGSVYNKVVDMDETSKKQEVAIGEMKDAQIRTAEAMERMEKQSKEFNTKIFDEIAKTNDKMSGMEARIIRNEVKIEEALEAIEELEDQSKDKGKDKD